MAEFYQRHIGPEFDSSGTGAQAQLLGNLANRLEQFRGERERDAEALRMAQFQNIANRAAIEAYQANPSDLDAYSRQFREAMRKVPTPVAHQDRYGAIVESTEAQYFWTIASNQGKMQHGELKYSAKEAANDFIRSGIRIQSGELSSPASARRGQLRFAQGA